MPKEFQLEIKLQSTFSFSFNVTFENISFIIRLVSCLFLLSCHCFPQKQSYIIILSCHGTEPAAEVK